MSTTKVAAKDTGENLFYKILIFVVSFFFTGLFTLNAIWFGRIRDQNPNDGCKGITSTEATVFFWMNLVLAIIAFIILLWSAYRLFLSPQAREALVTHPVGFQPAFLVGEEPIAPTAETAAQRTTRERRTKQAEERRAKQTEELRQLLAALPEPPTT